MTIYNEYSPQTLQPLPAAPEKRVWGGWATFGFSLVILLVFFVVQGIVVAVPTFVSVFSYMGSEVLTYEEMLELVMDDITGQLGLYQSLATIISGIAGVGMTLIFIRAKKGAGILEYLGIRKISLKTALIATGITLAVLAIVETIWWLLGIQSDENIMNQVYDTSISPVLFWIAVVIFAPFFEEALFRGFLYEGLRQSWLGLYGTIMLTSFGWAIVHGVQYNVAGVTYIFVLGVIMGIVRWKTNTIWSTFIMHAVVNLVAVIIMATHWGY